MKDNAKFIHSACTIRVKECSQIMLPSRTLCHTCVLDSFLARQRELLRHTLALSSVSRSKGSHKDSSYRPPQARQKSCTSFCGRASDRRPAIEPQRVDLRRFFLLFYVILIQRLVSWVPSSQFFSPRTGNQIFNCSLDLAQCSSCIAR
jgi:hypothetical protein